MMLLLAALKGIRTRRCFRLWVAALEQMRACLLVCVITVAADAMGWLSANKRCSTTHPLQFQ